MTGSNGELLRRGRGWLRIDPALRSEATEAGYRPKEEYI